VHIQTYGTATRRLQLKYPANGNTAACIFEMHFQTAPCVSTAASSGVKGIYAHGMVMPALHVAANRLLAAIHIEPQLQHFFSVWQPGKEFTVICTSNRHMLALPKGLTPTADSAQFPSEEPPRRTKRTYL
jgi:hypothetical protein